MFSCNETNTHMPTSQRDTSFTPYVITPCWMQSYILHTHTHGLRFLKHRNASTLHVCVTLMDKSGCYANKSKYRIHRTVQHHLTFKEIPFLFTAWGLQEYRQVALHCGTSADIHWQPLTSSHRVINNPCDNLPRSPPPWNNTDRLLPYPYMFHVTQCCVTLAGPSGRSPTEIMGSNPAEGMDVCLLWVLCVVR